jgi:hypothetical protein
MLVLTCVNIEQRLQSFKQMGSETHTWELAKAFMLDVSIVTLIVLVLFACTILVHFAGKLVARFVDLPRLPIFIRWLEYFMLALGLLVFAGIALRGTFIMLRHLIKL